MANGYSRRAENRPLSQGVRAAEYLLQNAGKAVTRTSIVEHVWDMHFDSFTNVVDVYVNYLRNKIDKPFSPTLIHTVRGVGYMLTDERDASA